MIAALISYSRRAFSDVLEGVALKGFLGATPQTPIFHLLLFYNTHVLCNAIVGLRVSIFRGVRGLIIFRKRLVYFDEGYSPLSLPLALPPLGNMLICKSETVSIFRGHHFSLA